MARWRFRRSLRIAPGIKLNVTGTGLGMSVGPRGFKVGFNPRQGVYVHQSIPKTGVYRRTFFGKSAGGAECSGPVTTAPARFGFFGWIRQLLFDVAPPDASYSNAARANITSEFLVNQESTFAGLADGSGSIRLPEDAPWWLKALSDEARYVAATTDPSQLDNQEWHGFSAGTSETGVSRCIAMTPVKQLIQVWAQANRHYKDLTLGEAASALRPQFSIMSSFQSWQPRYPEQYSAVIFAGGRVVHSTETFVLVNEFLPSGIYQITVATMFNVRDIGESLSGPFVYAIIRENDELRYNFHGGMR